MNKIKTPILMFTILIPLAASAESLFQGPIKPGFYLGPNVRVSRVNGDAAIFLGGEGAFLADYQWMAGIGGATLLTEHKVQTGRGNDPIKHIELSYMGLRLGYLANTSWLIHWTFGGLIGGGVSHFTTPDDSSRAYNDPDDGFFVIEPDLGAELNILSFMRFNASVSYRWVSWTTERYGVKSGDLSGPAAVFSLRFGKMEPSWREKYNK